MRFNSTRVPEKKNNSDCYTYRLDNGVVFPEEIPFKFQRSLSVISAEIIPFLKLLPNLPLTLIMLTGFVQASMSKIQGLFKDF